MTLESGSGSHFNTDTDTIANARCEQTLTHCAKSFTMVKLLQEKLTCICKVSIFHCKVSDYSFDSVDITEGPNVWLRNKNKSKFPL